MLAPALKIEAAGKEEVAKEQVRTDHKVNRTLFAIAITSVAAFFILTAYVSLNPRVISEQVATLADSIEAHWTVPLQNGERLYDKAGNYDLRKGIVKIALDNGVIVNIEGPALFAFINYDKMKLVFRAAVCSSACQSQRFYSGNAQFEHHRLGN